MWLSSVPLLDQLDRAGAANVGQQVKTSTTLQAFTFTSPAGAGGWVAPAGGRPRQTTTLKPHWADAALLCCGHRYPTLPSASLGRVYTYTVCMEANGKLQQKMTGALQAIATSL
jgi:hypothetical protein